MAGAKRTSGRKGAKIIPDFVTWRTVRTLECCVSTPLLTASLGSPPTVTGSHLHDSNVADVRADGARTAHVEVWG